MIGIAIGNSIGLDTRGQFAPYNVSPPVITGTPIVYQTLTLASSGSWIAPSPVTISRQWTRNGLPIVGATGVTYTLTNADADTNIACVVTVTNPIGFASASSNVLFITSYPQFLIDEFIIRVDNAGGFYEAEACQLAQLTFLNNIS
jgi:hypothetical protein